MIKSDNWLRQMCQEPTHTYTKANGVTELISEPFSLHQQRVHKATVARDILKTCTIANSQEREDKELFDPLIEEIRPISSQEIIDNWKPMISPFLPESVKHNEQGHRVVSSGLSSYGYDVRLASELKIFTNINSFIVDVYDLKEDCYVDAVIKIDDKGNKYTILPPNSFMLGHTIEYFNIPNDVLVVCVGKSTLARGGIGVSITPIEPGFSGDVVIELVNHTNLPVKIYTEVGISQFLFFQSDERCNVSYSDRGGKYQNQTGITMPKV